MRLGRHLEINQYLLNIPNEMPQTTYLEVHTLYYDVEQRNRERQTSQNNSQPPNLKTIPMTKISETIQKHTKCGCVAPETLL